MEFLIEIALKGLFITLLGCIILGLLRRQSAGIRHLSISWTLLSLLLLPGVVVLTPKLEVIPVSSSYPAILESEVKPLGFSKMPVKSAFAEPGFSKNRSIPIDPAKESPAFSLSSVLLCAWLAVFLFLFCQLLNGLYQIVGLTKRAKPIERGDTWLKFNLPRKLVLKYSAEIQSPMTWGVFRPVILLPENALHFSEEALKTILRHELAHIKRNDYLVHLGCHLTKCLYWFNPLVWLLKNRQTLEREKACDEMAVSWGISPIKYAEQLVSVSRNIRPAKKTSAAAALPFARVSQIKLRVQAVLGLPAHFAILSKKEIIRYSMGFLSFLPFIAALSPISPLEDVPGLESLLQHFEIQEPREIIRSPIKTETAYRLPASPPKINKSAPGNLDPLTRLPTIPLGSVQFSSPYERPVMPVAAKRARANPSTPTPQPSAFYSWREGNSTFQAWIYGEVEILQTEPYFSFSSDQDLIVIKEIKNAFPGVTTRFELMLSPAPYDGGLVQEFRGSLPNSYSSYRKGSILPFWFKNDQWVFLGKGKDAWMRKKLPGIVRKIQEEAPSNSAENDRSGWRLKIERYQTIKSSRFLPNNIISELHKEEKLDLPEAPGLDHFSPVPTPPVQERGYPGRAWEIGRKNPTKTTSGFSGNYNGEVVKFGALLPYSGGRAAVESFSFHIGHNLCSGIKFALHFYKVEDDELIGRYHAQPVLFEIGAEEGWISQDLSRQKIDIDADVLVILEILDMANDPNGRNGLFLSLDRSFYRTFEKRTQQKNWDFWDGAFAFKLGLSE